MPPWCETFQDFLMFVFEWQATWSGPCHVPLGVKVALKEGKQIRPQEKRREWYKVVLQDKSVMFSYLSLNGHTMSLNGQFCNGFQWALRVNRITVEPENYALPVI